MNEKDFSSALENILIAEFESTYDNDVYTKTSHSGLFSLSIKANSTAYDRIGFIRERFFPLEMFVLFSKTVCKLRDVR